MRKIIAITLGVLVWSCGPSNDEFQAYQDSFTPVKLGAGSLSVDSVQWNNAYARATKELYFTKMGRSASNIYKIVYENGSFSGLEQIPLPEGSQHSDVYVNPEGDLMLFSSLMQEHEKDTISDWNIWKSKRHGNQWQGPEPFFQENLEGNQFYPWLTDSDNLYFAITPHGSSNSDLHVSVYKDGSYQSPRALTALNTEHLEGDAFVAADESFIIFAGFDRAENLGKSDLFISFNENGQWSSPIWMGSEINSEGYDGSPFVNQDGKYLIYTSSRGSTDDNTFFNHYIVRFDANKYKSKNETI